MNTNSTGNIGQLKVAAELIAQDYDVFTQIGSKAPFDLVASKNGALYRVSVKTTTQKARWRDGKGWVVQLKTVVVRRKGNRIKNFDNSSCDILAVYVLPEDKVILYWAGDVESHSSLVVRCGNVAEPG